MGEAEDSDSGAAAPLIDGARRCLFAHSWVGGGVSFQEGGAGMDELSGCLGIQNRKQTRRAN